MKILVCIPSWGDKNVIYLKRILKTYNSYEKHDVVVFLFITNDIDTRIYKNIKIKKIIFPKEIRYLLVHQFKKYMQSELEKFDVFIYCEDDILITENNVNHFLQQSEKLKGTSLCPSFIRYESSPRDKYKYLIDLHPGNATSRHGSFLSRLFALKNRFFPTKIIYKRYTYKKESYLEPNNLHSGCFVLTKNQFKLALLSNNFLKGPSGGYCGVLESAASDIYYRCNLIKVYPESNLRNFLVHHLPNRYITEFKEQYKYNKHFVPNPKKLLSISKSMDQSEIQS